ncbi:hypothetical protein QCA50_004447 [Cerrena zonata]|uniref:Uncharacterized protein n=1 Tax=Cerrena zonata TaxID=2478898 RepID=A0AAW0GJH7_9APHY
MSARRATINQPGTPGAPLEVNSDAGCEENREVNGCQSSLTIAYSRLRNTMKKLFTHIFSRKRNRNIPTDPWPDAKLETKRLTLDQKLDKQERVRARRLMVARAEQLDDEIFLPTHDEGRPDVRIGGVKAVRGVNVKPKPKPSA